MNSLVDQLGEERVCVRSDSDDGMFEGQIMVFVNDTAHLTKLIQRLSRVNGVLQVERFDS